MRKTSTISGFFLNRFWEELFEIREKLFEKKYEDPLTADYIGDIFKVFKRLKNLVKLLPKDLQDIIDIENKKNLQLTNAEKKKIETRIGFLSILLVNNLPFGENEWKKRQERNRMLSDVMKNRIEDIMGKIVTLLHETIRKEVSKNETQ